MDGVPLFRNIVPHFFFWGTKLGGLCLRIPACSTDAQVKHLCTPSSCLLWFGAELRTYTQLHTLHAFRIKYPESRSARFRSTPSMADCRDRRWCLLFVGRDYGRC